MDSSKKHPTYYLLDVFTNEQFGGNQLALFPDASEINPELFQTIASEFNLSETVFLFPPTKEKENYSMRIFTPLCELPTAGHPTIGTAHFLASLNSSLTRITLNQEVGEIEVTINRINGKPDSIIMSQPLPFFGKTFDNKKAIAEMISINEEDVGITPIQEISCGNVFLFIPVRSAEILRQVKLNSAKWESLKNTFESIGIYIFSVKDVMDGDVQGRLFAPAMGIIEDPATGSANGPLACYIHKYDLLNFPIVSLQGLEMGRPSKLHLNIRSNANNQIDGVYVGGQSVIMGKGELFI